MTAKERVKTSLQHKTPDCVAVDFGGSSVTGMHALMIEKLRAYYGLPYKPVKIIEPLQMLGEIDDDLEAIINPDVKGVFGSKDMFGIKQEGFKEFKTPWGQIVLFPESANLVYKGADIYICPGGDNSAPPSGVMPARAYFFNAIERQEPIDDSKLNVEDNLEEFGPKTDEDMNYWIDAINKASISEKALFVSFGGTALGDIALVPGLDLKAPKGIRSVAEWYMSTVMRSDYIAEVYDKQTDIAIGNLDKLNRSVGDKIDVIFICGTDFGTQVGLICSPQTYEELYMPYYQKVNNWIHENTQWKTFKHCCGAVETLMERFIDSGFDIVNPVQINAKGMDSILLKEKYGDRLSFWGGGVDTQKVLPFGTPEDVKKQVRQQCEILGHSGGFVFNTIHNVQANVPVENVAAMIDTLNEIRNI